MEEIKVSPRVETAVLAVMKYSRAVGALVVAAEALVASVKSEGGKDIPGAAKAFETASFADKAARSEAIEACAGMRLTPRYPGEMEDLLILEGLRGDSEEGAG